MRNKLITFLAKVLPDSCPFAIRIVIFGVYLFTIPPACKLNPLYEEIMTKKLELLGYDV